MASKIWYRLPRPSTPVNLDGLIEVNQSNALENIQCLNQCIALFNLYIKWDGMWNLTDTTQRFSNDEKIYIYFHLNNPEAFLWLDQDYAYNFFVSPKVRKHSIAEKLTKATFNFNDYSSYVAYTEDWNKVTQNFVKKRLGGKEIISYI